MSLMLVTYLSPDFNSYCFTQLLKSKSIASNLDKNSQDNFPRLENTRKGLPIGWMAGCKKSDAPNMGRRFKCRIVMGG
jgi:hypothetical protein